MKNKRNMMAELARGLAEPSATEPKEEAPARQMESRKARKPAFRRATKEAKAEPTPTSALEKMTIKLEPAVREQILAESLRRKVKGLENWQIQVIVAEAVSKYLGTH